MTRQHLAVTSIMLPLKYLSAYPETLQDKVRKLIADDKLSMYLTDRYPDRHAVQSDRALGWQKPDGSNSAGHRMPEEAYGHTGFTGTSIWIDPKDDVFIVLLTNRVDPSQPADKRPRIFVLHRPALIGEHGQETLRTLTDAGYIVVLVEEHGHAERDR